MAQKVYLGLGSNGENAKASLEEALAGLDTLCGVRLVQCSTMYHTEPQGFRDQPWFTNCVCECAVEGLDPESMLRQCLALEEKLGRVRDPTKPRFGPRVIDIDLLLFGDITWQSETLLLPHPRMHTRAFVLYPLWEIAPTCLLYGKSLSWHLSQFAWRKEGLALYQ
ncbi:MAG: 2-amino-4-hydroxy-6-hydroxymethyldihydropteridine diphosphokinase [Desulfovibrio sp.]|nr:2-amino-4-hydroxy-6-hydroxymethyldihydropteridine diphosphokinase [Desulfovibrio sp.]